MGRLAGQDALLTLGADGSAPSANRTLELRQRPLGVRVALVAIQEPRGLVQTPMPNPEVGQADEGHPPASLLSLGRMSGGRAGAHGQWSR